MKKFLKEILLLTLTILYFLYSITYTTYIKNQISSTFYIWLTKIIPNLFPTFIIIDLIYCSNLPYYLNKYFHLNIIYFISIISGSPSNALAINKTNNQDKTKLLATTKYISLIFLYNTLKSIFNLKTTITLITCNILSNLTLALLLHPKKETISKTTIPLSSILTNIKFHMLTLLTILGTLIFFNTLPIFLIHNPLIKSFILSFLEITTFLNYLTITSIPSNIKLLFTTIAISTCGLCIETQIKSIISDTSVNYKQYYIYRLIHLILYMFFVFFFITIL